MSLWSLSFLSPFPARTCWIGRRVLSGYWWVQPFCFFSGQNSLFHVSDQKEGKQLWIKHAGVIPLPNPYLTAQIRVCVCVCVCWWFPTMLFEVCFFMILLSASSGYSLGCSVYFNHFSLISYNSPDANANRLCKYVRFVSCNRLFSARHCCDGIQPFKKQTQELVHLHFWSLKTISEI